MKKRWIGILLSIALAAGGTFVLVQYVGSADTRALAGQETTEVLIVTAPVAAGATVQELAASVTMELIPANVRAPDGVSTLTGLVGQVTAVDLMAGEQVLSTRFVSPEVLAEAAEVDVAPGLIEVTVSLSPERTVGGELDLGDLVTVFASFEPLTSGSPTADGADDGTPVEAGAGTPSGVPASTALIIHNAPVTHIQKVLDPTVPISDPADDSENGRNPKAPQDNMLVTLGIDPAQAAQLVYTAEFGTVWLGRESGQVAAADPRTWTRTNIYDALTEAAR
jgi:pilus assembly protein CpaB